MGITNKMINQVEQKLMFGTDIEFSKVDVKEIRFALEKHILLKLKVCDEINELRKFVEEQKEIVQNEKGDFRFDLIRWSESEPYWCAFACSHDDNIKIISSIDGVTGFGGHYCIGEQNIHEVLSLLSDSGWKVEIHPYYFNTTN